MYTDVGQYGDPARPSSEADVAAGVGRFRIHSDVSVEESGALTDLDMDFRLCEVNDAALTIQRSVRTWLSARSKYLLQNLLQYMEVSVFGLLGDTDVSHELALVQPSNTVAVSLSPGVACQASKDVGATADAAGNVVFEAPFTTMPCA